MYETLAINGGDNANISDFTNEEKAIFRFVEEIYNGLKRDCSWWLYRSLWGNVYSRAVDTTEFIMSEELYNELLKAYTKEALASMIKADIRQRFPEPYASMYC